MTHPPTSSSSSPHNFFCSVLNQLKLYPKKKNHLFNQVLLTQVSFKNDQSLCAMTMHKMPHTQAEIKIKKKLMELENNR